MRKLIRNSTKLVLLVLLGVGAQDNDASKIPTVSFCDLVRYPKQYDRRIIRTTAIYEAHYHGTFLYDPNCNSSDANISAELERSGSFKTLSVVERQLEKLMSQNEKYGAGRARVAVIGRFNDWNGVGYGHLNGSRFRFDVMAIESAKPVAAAVPWNAKDDTDESFMKDVERIKGVLDVAITFAYLLNDGSKLEGVLPADYLLTNEQQIVLHTSQVISLANSAGRVSTGSSMIDEHEIFIEGNTAVVTGRATSGNCKNVTRQYRFTNTYSKRKEDWEIISSRLVSVAPVEVPNTLPCN